MVTLTVEAPSVVDGPQLLDEIEVAVGERPEVSRSGSSVSLVFVGEIDPLTVQTVIDAHRPTEIAQLDQLVTKARAVWNETDTFTQAQAQKILAGLVLLENRRR